MVKLGLSFYQTEEPVSPRKLTVDLLLVKLLGLLICPGDQYDKSEIWFDAMLGDKVLTSPKYKKE